MISESQNYYTTAWWFILFPGSALLVTTLAFNLFGDGVRDAFDPRADRYLIMAMFLLRRIGHGILVLWLISVAVFALFFVAPSNVAQTLAGRQGTPETIALIKHRLGLDLPVWQQYLHFLGNAVQGNLGYDYYHQVPVTHDHRAGAADHGVAGTRCGRAVAGARRVQRSHLGNPSAVAGGPRADVVRVVLLLVPVVPARLAAAVFPVLPAHAVRLRLVPRGRLLAAHRRCRALVPAPAAALGRARLVAGSNVYPVDPRLDAGRSR